MASVPGERSDQSFEGDSPIPTEVEQTPHQAEALFEAGGLWVPGRQFAVRLARGG
jgi:hypothetical protein